MNPIEEIRKFEQWREERILMGAPTSIDEYQEWLRQEARDLALDEILDYIDALPLEPKNPQHTYSEALGHIYNVVKLALAVQE